MGSYGIDSHNIQRYITPEGYVQNEGDIGVSTNGPYQISYGSLVPKKGQAANLLVPVCLSSSHIAYGSIRMEPVFMILGQSAATAAVMAIEAASPCRTSRTTSCARGWLLTGRFLSTARLRSNQAASGTVKRKVDPAPGSLSTQMRPPWTSTTLRQIARPMPVPGYSERA